MMCNIIKSKTQPTRHVCDLRDRYACVMNSMRVNTPTCFVDGAKIIFEVDAMHNVRNQLV